MSSSLLSISAGTVCADTVGAGTAWSRAEREPSSGRASDGAAPPPSGESGESGETDDSRGAAAPVADDELMRAARAGDEQAFVALYRRWQGPIYRFALHMGGSETLAEDVTQEVFVALAEEGHRFDAEKGHLSSYLFGIARNLLRRRLRREGFYEAAEAGPGDGVLDPALDPGGALDRHEAIQLVRRAVCALPVAFREAIVLCDLQELSYADAAAAIGCPVGTVRSRLHRARAMLAERLGAATSTTGAPTATTADPVKGGEP